MIYRLTAVRGQRRVLIGWFPSRQRASIVFYALDWDPSWKPVIKSVNPSVGPSSRYTGLPT